MPSLSCRVWIFTALFLDHIDKKHQISLWWMAWRDEGTVTKPLKAIKNLTKISVNTLVSLLRKAQFFLSGPERYIHSPVKAGTLERAQFLPPYAASPGGGTNRRAKYKVGLRTRVLSLRNCSLKQQFASPKDQSQRNVYFLPDLAIPSYELYCFKVKDG